MGNSASAASSADASTLAAVLGIISSFFLVILAVAVIWYVLQAFGFYKMAKNRDLPYAWISWIPLCQYYIMGDLIGNRLWGFGFTNWALVLGSILSTLLSYVVPNIDNSFVLLLILVYYIVYYVYQMTAFYRLYQMYSDHPTLFLVLSIIFPFLTAIFIFAIRDNKPKPIVK